MQMSRLIGLPSFAPLVNYSLPSTSLQTPDTESNPFISILMDVGKYSQGVLEPA